MLTIEKTPDKPLEYPKLMISDQGKLVLFEACKCGMQLLDNGVICVLYSSQWNMSQFTDYHGKVTFGQTS